MLARIRGVRLADASRGSGYGEVFDAMVLLHQDHPGLALEILTAPTTPGLFSYVFRSWSDALAAEAAVLSSSPEASRLLDVARRTCEGNPLTTAITRRAAALLTGDVGLLETAAAELGRAGSTYQQRRTLALTSKGATC